jgi:ribosomal protein L36
MCDNCRLIRRKRKILVICTNQSTNNVRVNFNKQNKKVMAKQIEKQLKNEDSETTQRCSSHSINFNNTIVTITNLKGEVISWSSAGAAGLSS